MTSPDGLKYVGGYKDGEFHGQGTWTMPNGSKYVGEFRNGKIWIGSYYDRHGEKILMWINGEKKKKPIFGW